MRFSPFAFVAPANITANLYFDVDNQASYVSGSTSWNNIGVTGYQNPSYGLLVSSSWYNVDTTGSYIQVPNNTNLAFPDVLGGQPTTTTYIYEVDLSPSFRLMGRDNLAQDYWCNVNSGFFGAQKSFYSYQSTLALTPQMQNQFFYLSVLNKPNPAFYGDVFYSTSLDNFNTVYQVNFGPTEYFSVAFEQLVWLATGIGKVKSIAGYFKELSTAELQNYVLKGPVI
jgi:hypothetical protein